MSDIKSTLNRELPLLREIASVTGDSRLSALLLAASDLQVQQILEERLNAGNLYVGALVTHQTEHFQVVFSFSRAEGLFGLLPLSVLAIVNLQERRIVQVIDYYLGESAEVRSQSILGALQSEMDLVRLMQDRSSADRPTQRAISQRVANGPNSWWV